MKMTTNGLNKTKKQTITFGLIIVQNIIVTLQSVK